MPLIEVGARLVGMQIEGVYERGLVAIRSRVERVSIGVGNPQIKRAAVVAHGDLQGIVGGRAHVLN